MKTIRVTFSTLYKDIFYTDYGICIENFDEKGEKIGEIENLEGSREFVLLPFAILINRLNESNTEYKLECLLDNGSTYNASDEWLQQIDKLLGNKNPTG